MYIITGAAGFIGSCLVQFLNERGISDLILADDFSREDKRPNWEGKQYRKTIDRLDLADWMVQQTEPIAAVFHLGARTDTTEAQPEIFQLLNVGYSRRIWQVCKDKQIPLIYASSAATYGAGEAGYSDDHARTEQLQPLNPYGQSKQDFDCWALAQATTPPHWYGLKFFNVYGPNEYHKGRMASVIFHTAQQIEATGGMRLFRSHRPDVADGEQSRDFIYVKDVVAIMWWLYEQRPASGLYNVGTGQARTFLDLAKATFRALGREPQISFIDTPLDIRNTYQYFTQADMHKLRAAGYTADFYSLEAGIEDYVSNYLRAKKTW